MSWFKKVQYIKLSGDFGKNDWSTARNELKSELRRDPTMEEVQKRIFKNRWGEPLKGDIRNIPLVSV